MINTSCSPYT